MNRIRWKLTWLAGCSRSLINRKFRCRLRQDLYSTVTVFPTFFFIFKQWSYFKLKVARTAALKKKEISLSSFTLNYFFRQAFNKKKGKNGFWFYFYCAATKRKETGKKKGRSFKKTYSALNENRCHIEKYLIKLI